MGSFVFNYQEFLYSLITDTSDSSKMWDMSHFFEYDLRLKTNQMRKFALNLSYNKEKALFLHII